VGFAFVDDTDLVVSHFGNLSGQTVVEEMQRADDFLTNPSCGVVQDYPM
jgi:hypothetical protein